MKIIILAGGKGTRLPESAKHIPKPLVEVAAKPILAHQIDLLQKQGFFDIRLSLGHRADQIVAWVRNNYPAVECVVETEPRGTGGAIHYASADLHEPFLVFNGDLVADFDVRGVVARGEATGKNIMLGLRVPDATDLGVLAVDATDRVSAFLERPSAPGPGIINAGLYYLQPNLFRAMPESFSIEKSFFPKLAERGELHHVAHKGKYWFDCGTEERLKEVRAFLASSQ